MDKGRGFSMTLSLAERLQHIRKYKNLSQKNLVSDDVSRVYLSRVENGVQQPSHNFLSTTAEKLQIPLNLLADGTYDKNVDEIYQHYFQTKKLLPSDEIFFYLSTLESPSKQDYLKLHATLLHYYSQTTEKRIDLAEQALLKISKEQISEFPQEGFRFYMSCGECYYCSQRFHEADQYYTLAEKLYKPNDPIELIDLYHSLSLTKQRISVTYQLCMIYTEKAYEIMTIFLIKKRITVCLLNTLCVQHCHIANYEKALLYVNEALELLEVVEVEPSLKSALFTNKAKVYQALKQNGISVSLFEESIEWDKQINNQSGIIYALRGLAEIFMEEKQFQEAKKYVDEAIVIADRLKRTYLYIELQRLDAHLEKENGQIKKYEKKIKVLITFSVNNKQFLWVSKLSRELAEHFDKKDDRRNANIYYQKHFYYMDKI